MDPDLPLTEFRTLEEVRGASVARPRLLASLVTAFGVLALVLAGVGVYGVVSYGVRRRTAEFGIRMALGADGRRVRSLVLRESALLILVGLGSGALAVPLVARPLGDLLYQVGPGDPVTLGGVAVVLASVALLASWLPARRATRVDPMESLRSE
jgi:ABC-type antimicrobial peptide transport system permease subunit